MKSRKRAPGGGRKPSGEFRNLTVVKSVRMPRDLYDQLERARQVGGRSFNQELLNRAKKSFDHDRDRPGDRSLRAFCFLFSELVQVICVNPEQVPDWRLNPWLFQAFRLAVPKLLDHFRPAGKRKLPEFWLFAHEADFASHGLPDIQEWGRRVTKSPEAMAGHAVQKVLADFSSPQRVRRMYETWKGVEVAVADDPQLRRIAGHHVGELASTGYGMDQAQRDLAPKPKGRK
jgi:hypothetical protein